MKLYNGYATLKDITKIYKGTFYLDTDFYCMTLYSTRAIEEGEQELPEELLDKYMYLEQQDFKSAVVKFYEDKEKE